MARRRRGGYYRQAELDSLVRFGPEMAGLLELANQARANLKGDVRAARGNARNIIAATDRARPEINEVYSDAAAAQAQFAPQVAGSPLSAVLQAEQQAAAGRVGESRANALDDLSARRVSAREGQQFAVQKARGTFADEIGQIMRREQSLRGEMGAFTAATAGNLRKEDRDRAQQLLIAQGGWSQQERNSLRSAGIDPNTGAALPGGTVDPDADGKPGDQGKGKNGGRDWLTPTQQSAAADTAAEALRWAEKLKEAGSDLSTAKAMLAEGRDPVEAKPLYDPVTGKKQIWQAGEKGNEDGAKTGQPKMTPPRAGTPQIKSTLILQAALEQAYNGYVSPATIRKLRRRGIKPRKLDLVLYADRPKVNSRSDSAQG
jgi:hypothetical protein